MKHLKIMCLIAVFYLYNNDIYGQVTYTLSNYSSYYLEVVFRVANDPNQCNFYQGLPTRTIGPFSLSPVSCSYSSRIVTLGTNDWVYHVDIYEEGNCATSCLNPTLGTFTVQATLQPCNSNPASASWNNCVSGSNATANLTSACDIY